MQSVEQTLRNLIVNERGNVLTMFGLTSIIAIAAVGGAVDFGRAYSSKSRMQAALDAAVVSGVGKFRETGEWEGAKSEALAIFQSAYSNAVSPTVENPIPTASYDRPVVSFTSSGSQLTGTAIMQVSAPFVGLVTGHWTGNPLHLDVSVQSSGVPPTGQQLEVALMVDLTGSMGWDAATGSTSTPCGTIASPSSKIDYLKCAGEDLLNILLPSSGVNNASVKIGVAPFADYVNAGEYASAATGLAATGGAYSNILNLASRKQGSFSGSYSGVTGNTGGSHYGATGASVPSGGTSAAGATFSNSYCAVPQVTNSIDIVTYQSYRTGIRINREDGADDEVQGLIYVAWNASTNDKFKEIDSVDGSGNNWTSYKDDLKTGYFVPRPSSTTGLTRRTLTDDVWISTGRRSGYYQSVTADAGAKVDVDDDFNHDNLVSMGYVKASTTTAGGYWRLKQVKASGNHEWEWTDYGYYLPIYTSLSTTATVAGCETPVVAQPSSKLISCVTERMNGSSLDYTDAAPTTGNYIGAYNHGVTSKSNYSSDGKCLVAGRELPPVIPLTNDRTTLVNFFEDASVGGATPGHLGTAWAQYLLSPAWSNIWPSASTPAAYSNAGVKKAAILMTDGEYNLQFYNAGTTSNNSAKQALMLCKQMRDNGIKVYTVGFGFGENATPPTTDIEALSEDDRTTPLATGGSVTAKERALDTLAKCASTNASYYFPYDGEALRTVFKNIASGLASDVSGGRARLTN